MTRTRYKVYETSHPYFLTCTCVGWLPIFSHPEVVKVVLDSWRLLQAEKRVILLGYVVLENHLHFIGRADDISKQVGDFKSFTARTIVDWLIDRRAQSTLQQLEFYRAKHKPDRDYQLWQEGSHPQMIQSDEMMWHKLEYIHSNPVRRGYVDDPLHWRYSSARNYARMPSLLEVTTQW
jgi:REP element-mobilizing transposase RayT